MSEPPPSPSPSARARTEQMRAQRAAEAERAKRRQRALVAVGGVVILGLVVAIVWALVNATGGDDEGTDAPRSNGGEVVAPANDVDGAVPVGEEDAPVTVDLYFDYMCPACAAFEAQNAPDLTRLVEDGTARVLLRPMNFLDARSNGTQYSTRAANALATVADQAPEAVWDFHNALYANLPSEGTDGLTDEQIAEIATESGVPDEVAADFTDGTHDAWVVQSNNAAGEAGVDSTPTIKIDGESFEGDWSQPGTLAAAIEAAAEGE